MRFVKKQSVNGGIVLLIDHITKSLIQLALAEDIGRGDCTTDFVVSPDTQAQSTVWIKQSARVAGLPLLTAVFHMVDPNLEIATIFTDGQDVIEKAAVCTVQGSAQSILRAERTALNFLSRLCGIATVTRYAVSMLEATSVTLLDTRKTTPGWRSIEKYAVTMGGGHNHRYGLDDMILIKDNHIVVAGGVSQAIERAKVKAALSQKIEVEVDTLEQFEIALNCGVDVILLDNMTTDMLKKAVVRNNGRVLLEASGNMSLQRLVEVAETGVNYISMGALTHAATSVDVGLEVAIL